MKRYLIINPRSGKQIDGYELNIDDDSRVSILSYKHREPRILQLTLHTDAKGYQSYRVKLNGESFVVAQIVYSSVYRKEIGNDCVIHHKDLNPFNNAIENLKEMLGYCKKYQVPVVVGSDAHVDLDVGRFGLVDKIFEECDFPEELVVSTSLEKVKSFMNRYKK
jgi:hypothetical protein